MPTITSNHVNYLVWRYLQEEGLALSAYTLDREAHAGQWAAEFRDSTSDGELVKLVLKGLQMLEIEKTRLPPELLATSRAKPVNLEPVPTAAPLPGAHAAAVVSGPTSADPPAGQALIIGGPAGVAAYALPALTPVASDAFAASEVATFIEAAASADSVFVGYENGAVRQWVLSEKGTELQSLFMAPDGEHAPITGLKRAPSGQLLASIDVRNTVALWDISARVLVSRIDLGGLEAGLLSDIVWVADTMFGVLQHDGIGVYTVGDSSPRKRFHAPRASQLAFDTVSRLLASGSDDGQVCLWSSHSEEAYGVMRGHEGPITFVGWAADAPMTQPQLLTASTDGWLKLWSLGESAPTAAVNAEDPVYAVQISDVFIAALTKHGVKVFTKALKCVAHYPRDGVQSIVLHGRTLAVAAKNETVVYTIGLA